MRTRGAWLALVAGLFLSGGARAQLHAGPATAWPGNLQTAPVPSPGSQPLSPGTMTYEFVFRHFTSDDERAAGNDDFNAAPPQTRTLEVYWIEPAPDPD